MRVSAWALPNLLHIVPRTRLCVQAELTPIICLPRLLKQAQSLVKFVFLIDGLTPFSIASGG